MRLTEDKISHISHLLIDGAQKEGLVTYEDRSKILKATKATVLFYLKLDDEVDTHVRKTLASYSRNVAEGSREWDVLYRKHFDEEIKKRWR